MIALSAGIQYLLTEILDLSMIACRQQQQPQEENHGKNSCNNYVITSRHIEKAIVEDKELSETVVGMIRTDSKKRDTDSDRELMGIMMSVQQLSKCKETFLLL